MLEVKVGRVRKGMPPGMSAPKTKTLRRFGLLILMQRLLRPTIRMPTVTMWGLFVQTILNIDEGMKDSYQFWPY